MHAIPARYYVKTIYIYLLIILKIILFYRFLAKVQNTDNTLQN